MPTSQVFEQQRNSYCAGTFRDDGTLYLAESDVSDSDDLGVGLIIGRPAELLRWMLADRWCGCREEERLFRYCERNGFLVVEDPSGPPAPDVGLDELAVSVVDDTVYVHSGDWGGALTAHRIADPQPLLLQLIADRCEGLGAWNGVTALVSASGVEVEAGWRGYI